MFSRRIVIAVVTACVVLAAVIAGLRRNGPQQSETISVTVAQWGQEKYLIYLPLYIAQEAGSFAKRGLNVRLVFSGNDDQVFASVFRGDAQFGIGDPIFAAISRNRGGDGVVVGQLVGRVALWGVAKNPRITKANVPADFANLTVGTFPKPSTTYTLVRNMLDQNHVPGAKIAEVPIGTEPALLESGGADIVMMLEPAASIAASKGFRIVTSFPSLWGDFAFTGLTSTRTQLNKNPALAQAMQSALQDALSLAHSQPEQALSIAERLFPSIEKSVVRAAVERMLRDETIPKNFSVSEKGWEAAVKVRQQMGELRSDVNYSDVVVR